MTNLVFNSVAIIMALSNCPVRNNPKRNNPVINSVYFSLYLPAASLACQGPGGPWQARLAPNGKGSKLGEGERD